jgi:ABC-type sugar transport system ATPase subunit
MTTTSESSPETRKAVPLVKLTGAGKSYGSIIALSGIDLEAGAGEVTCVLGDNGAGKSTLIKIIAGLHRPSTGTYEVEGEPVHFSSPREALERSIGLYAKEQITREELTGLMADGGELEALSHELESMGGAAASAAQEMEAEVQELGLGQCPPEHPG